MLPHFHYLGDSFRVDVVGGPDDGKNLYTLDGFDADANGRTFDPPVELAGSTGLRFSCGFDNWRDKDIGWGIGDQEMCMMLGLADSRAIMDMSVMSGSEVVGKDGEVLLNEGPCSVLALPKNKAQTMPTEEERTGEFYVPPTGEDDVDLEPDKRCVDSDPAAAPSGTTLSHLRGAVFTPGCIFSSCRRQDADDRPGSSEPGAARRAARPHAGGRRRPAAGQARRPGRQLAVPDRVALRAEGQQG